MTCRSLYTVLRKSKTFCGDWRNDRSGRRLPGGEWKISSPLGASNLARQSLELLQQGAEKYQLGVQIVGINLLDVHPPVAIVPNYRDVANALEEREQLLNEAQTTYVRELYSAVGEAGVKSLESAAQREVAPAAKVPTDQLPAWKLDDSIWLSLVTKPGDQQQLAGKSGAMLQAARQSETEQIESATADAERFSTLLGPYQAQPWLTRLHLYWSALEKSLSNTAMTIVDPAAKGRRQLFLSDSPVEAPPPPVIVAPPEEKPDPNEP